MAFYLGTTKVVDTTASPGVFPIPVGTGTYGTGVDQGAALYNNGTNAYFAYPGNTYSTVGGTFETRSIFTHGFICGGYKNSNPWRTVHKTWHMTDTTYSVGEQLQMSVAYCDGSFSDYNGYIFGVGGQGAYSQTGSINLHTGISRNRMSQISSGGITGLFGMDGLSSFYGYGSSDSPASTGQKGQDNPATQSMPYGGAAAQPATPEDIYIAAGVGGWAMNVTRDACGSGVNQMGQEGYITGGNSSVTNRLHFGTEIMYTTTDSGIAGNYATAAHGQTAAFFNCGGSKKYITYSNQAWTSYSSTQSTDGQGKYLSTKKTWHYIGQGTNTSSRYITKFSETTISDVTTTLDRGFIAGEENNQMGQEWGYCLGQYDGQQNNKSHKMTYSNDTVTVLGAAGRPKGHYGMSSAAGMSAAATITSAYAV
jgi:hypothetical protein